MSIKGFSEQEFASIVNTYLLPSSPVRSFESLRGRSDQLEQIRVALLSPGRHVFIYGDRGVGKTSLAQTAAFIHHSSRSTPILLACDSNTTLYQLVKDLASRLLLEDPTLVSHGKSLKGGLRFHNILTLEMQETLQQGKVPIPASINDAVALLKYAEPRDDNILVAVVDEFERLTDSNEKALFGDFIKQCGDQDVRVKRLFSGVGESLTQLLDGHESCFRYLSSIRLERLGWDPRMEIVSFVASKLSLHIDREYLYRIAAISDGFPHYVHLIGHKLFWEIYNDSRECSEVSSDHFLRAIRMAVSDVEHHLHAIYAKATEKYNDDYKEVLWAVADHPDLRRRSSDIFTSYLRIMKERKHDPLARTSFNNRMNNLKRESHGCILKGTRQSWYEYSEPIVRGYARLRAEEVGVKLDIEHGLQPQTLARNQ